MKTALVTGISRGIGAAICEALVLDGFFVYGTYRTGKQEATAIKDRLGAVECAYLDCSDRDSTQRFLEEMKGHKFDALVTNVGIIEFEEFDDFDFSIWDKTLETNLSAPLLIVMGLQKNIKDDAERLSSFRAPMGQLGPLTAYLMLRAKRL